MTRKRFIKLMMGMGYSRNEVNELAARARRYGMSYADRWRHERIKVFSRGFASGLEAVSRRIDELAAVFQNATSSAMEAARKCAAALAATIFYKIDPADDAEEPAPAWPKENPHLDGLRIHHSFVDELAMSAPPLTHEQVMATTAEWPGGTYVLVGIDLADGPDMAAEIPVAGGAVDGE